MRFPMVCCPLLPFPRMVVARLPNPLLLVGVLLVPAAHRGPGRTDVHERRLEILDSDFNAGQPTMLFLFAGIVAVASACEHAVRG